MRFSVLQSGHLWRGAAIAVLAGLGAGCSSDFSRFAPQSSDYTGSVNQQQIIFKGTPERQNFPSDIAPAQVASNTQAFPAPSSPGIDYQNAPVGQPMYTGSVGADGQIRPTVSNVSRKALAPVVGTGAVLAAGAGKIKQSAGDTMTAARRAVTPVPLTVAEEAIEPVAKIKNKISAVDDTVTGTVERAKKASDIARQPMPDVEAVASRKADDAFAAAQEAALKKAAPVVAAGQAAKTGWSAKNAPSVIARDGETLSALSARYGVPVAVLVEANGLSSPDALRSGQKVIIPTPTAIKAPWNNVAQTKPLHIPTEPVKKIPVPQNEPNQVAVLPSIPEVKAKKQESSLASASQSDASKSEQAGIRILSRKTEAAKPLASAKVDPIQTASIKPSATAKTSGGYSVASGDSLYSIAKKHGTTVAALKAANNVGDGNLKIGQKLNIPTAGKVIAAAAPAKAAASAKLPAIDPITTGSATASAPKKPPVIEPAPLENASAPSNAVIEEAEKDSAAAPGSTGISKLRWPVKGRTLTSYGQADAGQVNDGIDISVPNGTPVKAAENGVVIYAGTGLKDFGNTVLIKHDNGLVTVYGHAGDINVKRGQTVKRGQEIAKSGMSGNTKVPKLHFEVRKDSKPINPSSYLE